MISPTDLVHPSPAPRFKVTHVLQIATVGNAGYTVESPRACDNNCAFVGYNKKLKKYYQDIFGPITTGFENVRNMSHLPPTGAASIPLFKTAALERNI